MAKRKAQAPRQLSRKQTSRLEREARMNRILIASVATVAVLVVAVLGYGFISDEDLFNNGYIELGYGRFCSCKGDWGGGFDSAKDSPLKMVIDKDYRIVSASTASFYNNKRSQVVEAKAKGICKQLEGKFLTISDKKIKHHLDIIFKMLPVKAHLGIDYSPDCNVYFENDFNAFVKNAADAIRKEEES